MATYNTLVTFDTAEVVLRIDTDKFNGISRGDRQAIGIQLVCASTAGTGSMTLEQGNSPDEAEAVACVYVDPSDGSTTAISQAISDSNFFIPYFGADACRYIFLRFPATLTAGTAEVWLNQDFEVTDVS